MFVDQPISLHIETASDADAAELVEFFGRHPDVALLAWQDADQVHRQLSYPAVLALLARCPRGTIIAALIGGAMGTRAMINHVAVDTAYRRSGAGRLLVESFEQEIKLRGVRRYFLFVARKNAAAKQFWEKLKMRPTTAEEITLERNLA